MLTELKRGRDLTQALALCNELGITCLPESVRRQPSQTHSVSLISELIRRHGEQHTYSVLATLMESENNRCHLVSPVIGAISDLYCRYPDWAKNISDTLNAFDAVDLNYVWETAKATPGRDGAAPDKRQVVGAILTHLLAPVLNGRQPELIG